MFPLNSYPKLTNEWWKRYKCNITIHLCHNVNISVYTSTDVAKLLLLLRMRRHFQSHFAYFYFSILKNKNKDMVKITCTNQTDETGMLWLLIVWGHDSWHLSLSIYLSMVLHLIYYLCDVLTCNYHTMEWTFNPNLTVNFNWRLLSVISCCYDSSCS